MASSEESFNTITIEPNFVILKVAVPSVLRTTFDYFPPANIEEAKLLAPGMRVLVSFGKRQLVGLVMEIADRSNYNPEKIKPVLKLLDTKPMVTSAILKLISWTSEYYHHPIGDVLVNVLPVMLRAEQKQQRKSSATKSLLREVEAENIVLNAGQQQAVAAIKQAENFKTFLLAGVTGSGKTEVYLQVIADLLDQGKQALVLVPEINLTPQTIARFRRRFAVPVVELHSRCTKKERLESWNLAACGKAQIIIGTRSAIFTPLPKLGIIIIDEEHDASFKQQAGLRYSARDLAIMRGKIEQVPVVLGSATPSFESINNVQSGRYIRLSLPERAGEAVHPQLQLIDMRVQTVNDGIAESLLRAIQERLDQNEQVLLFLNRRGYAPVVLCQKCGWTAECKYCDAKMILHQQEQRLHCHHCGLVQKVPQVCPACHEPKLLALGIGTERVEKLLQQRFPIANIVRVDRDTTRPKGSIEEMLAKINKREYQILIGTQMLAKGHHFPNVTLSAVLNIDQCLYSSDFRAGEQVAQLIIQVAGRAGRAAKPGMVYIQTYNPKHPLLLKLIKEGYQSFAEQGLQERLQANLPPFSSTALIRVEARQKQLTYDFLAELQDQIRPQLPSGVAVYGPIPALLERKANWYHAQLLVQSLRRDVLHTIIEAIMAIAENMPNKSKVKWLVEVDPLNLL